MQDKKIGIRFQATSQGRVLFCLDAVNSSRLHQIPLTTP